LCVLQVPDLKMIEHRTCATMVLLQTTVPAGPAGPCGPVAP
jgi:hypothetical protein